jgi:glutamyl-tRNA reductase
LDQGRKFAPTIALKEKLNAIKTSNWTFKAEKYLILTWSKLKLSAQESYKKITTLANHLKDDDTMVDESIEWIERVFKMLLPSNN